MTLPAKRTHTRAHTHIRSNKKNKGTTEKKTPVPSGPNRYAGLAGQRYAGLFNLRPSAWVLSGGESSKRNWDDDSLKQMPGSSLFDGDLQRML